jgi:hypothetical protein
VFLSDSLGIMRRINTILRLCASPNLEAVEQHNKAVGHQARKKYTMMSTPHGAAEKCTMFCMSRAILPFHVQV